ncbi:MAG TPA: RluA family pseudouridine synthase [Leucothrix mucor]|nr:RluA family pseudouridine synthase [Leucothrix mucor]
MTDKPSSSQETKTPPIKQSVRFVTVTEFNDGQRIDNFLMRELKNVPRSYIYRILRKGEVRVNKKRAKPTKKLQTEDIVRIPPMVLPEQKKVTRAPQQLLDKLEKAILLEDQDIILINKPAGLAVHGGTGSPYGLIESFRQLRQNLPFVELAHRLDKETSGIVILAKNRKALLSLHELFKSGGIDKYYQTLVYGQWQAGKQHVTNTLKKERGRKQKVQVQEGGKLASSIFHPKKIFADTTLMEVKLLTGRMHQIRTQLADKDFPILGDTQYGNFALNREYKKKFGLKRLFLHSYRVKFKLPLSGKTYQQQIPLAPDLLEVLSKLP